MEVSINDKEEQKEEDGQEHVVIEMEKGQETAHLLPEQPRPDPPTDEIEFDIGPYVHVNLGSKDDDERNEVFHNHPAIRWNIHRTTTKPRRCCCQMSWLWVHSMIILVVLSKRLRPPTFIIDVPFYNRLEINKAREDSFSAAQDYADFLSSIQFGEPRQQQQQQDDEGVCIHTDPTRITRNGTILQTPLPSPICQRAATNVFRIMYVAKDRKSNIITRTNLQKIKEIEQFIFSNLELSKYCTLTNNPIIGNNGPLTTRGVSKIRLALAFAAAIAATASDEQPLEQTVVCQRMNSPLNFFDSLYYDYVNETGFGYHLLPPDIIPQEYDLSEQNIQNVLEYWNSFSRPRRYDFSDSATAVATIGESITLSNLFYQVVSSDFVAEPPSKSSTSPALELISTTAEIASKNPKQAQQQPPSQDSKRVGAIGLMSTYPLGYPLHGYESATENLLTQYDKTGKWLWEQYDTVLQNYGDDEELEFDIYFADSRQGMFKAESQHLAMRAFSFFPFSLLFILLYLIYMQDSIFIGLVGIAQILLSFIPSVILYTYLFDVRYLGVLNLISLYIILGIGVDDIFVFCDQFKHQKKKQQEELLLQQQEEENANKKQPIQIRFDSILQSTFNVAGKAMLTTSCTTFLSFVSNATSAFPVVSAFGLFSALLVFVNYCAIISFFPAAYTIYYKYIYYRWFDHPSLLFCSCFCKQTVNRKKELLLQEKQTMIFSKDDTSSKEIESANNDNQSDDDEMEKEHDISQEAEENVENKEIPSENHESYLVTFFRDIWAPIIIKLRFIIVLFFLGVLVGAIILTLKLEPDDSLPNTLKEDNNYLVQQDILLKYFARAGNPRAIDVLWISGIDPDHPIDRTGTRDTNTTDYGTVNFVDCNNYNPTTPRAQIWILNTCHDMFFGNVTDYHDDTSIFSMEGSNGPQSRKIVSEFVLPTEFTYYQKVSCVMQGFRDWLLTDSGCMALTKVGLQCYNETKLRTNCNFLKVSEENTNEIINSCEPFPVPQEHYRELILQFIFDPYTDPTTRQTNFDKYSEQIFVGETIPVEDDVILRPDYSCRFERSNNDDDTSSTIGDINNNKNDNVILYATANKAILDQDSAIKYVDGIDLYNKWDAWSTQMRKYAPDEMKGTMLTSSNGSWSFYFLNQKLLSETFRGIVLALVLSFVILSFVGGNPVMSFFSVLTIVLIVMNVFAFTVIIGWNLGVIEAVNYVVVIGMSIDYTVHMSEAYNGANEIIAEKNEQAEKNKKKKESSNDDHQTTSSSSSYTIRQQCVVHMIEEMGVSVLSGAISTLGATFFMLFAPNKFFVKFATFLFVTISLSCIYSLIFFPALLSIIGPTGNFGFLRKRLIEKYKQNKHEQTINYLQSIEFKKRELSKYNRK